jgi:hypothetical protein
MIFYYLNNIKYTKEELLDKIVKCYIKIYNKLLYEYDIFILDKKKYLFENIYNELQDVENSKILTKDFLLKVDSIIKQEDILFNYNY